MNDKNKLKKKLLSGLLLSFSLVFTVWLVADLTGNRDLVQILAGSFWPLVVVFILWSLGGLTMTAIYVFFYGQREQSLAWFSIGGGSYLYVITLLGKTLDVWFPASIAIGASVAILAGVVALSFVYPWPYEEVRNLLRDAKGFVEAARSEWAILSREYALLAPISGDEGAKDQLSHNPSGEYQEAISKLREALADKKKWEDDEKKWKEAVNRLSERLAGLSGDVEGDDASTEHYVEERRRLDQELDQARGNEQQAESKRKEAEATVDSFIQEVERLSGSSPDDPFLKDVARVTAEVETLIMKSPEENPHGVGLPRARKLYGESLQLSQRVEQRFNKLEKTFKEIFDEKWEELRCFSGNDMYSRNVFRHSLPESCQKFAQDILEGEKSCAS